MFEDPDLDGPCLPDYGISWKLSYRGAEISKTFLNSSSFENTTELL